MTLQSPSFDFSSFPVSDDEPLAELVPSHLIPAAPPSAGAVALDEEVRAELVNAALIPPVPRMLSLREVVAGPAETPDSPVGQVQTGLMASVQRIVAGTIAIGLVLAVLVGVSFGVMNLLTVLDNVGGGTQTQDLFAVGVWGLLILVEGRPRLAKPGKRSKKKNSMSLSGFVVVNPVLSAGLTLAGLFTAGDMMAVPTLAVAGISLGVIGWRGTQAVQALRKRNAHFQGQSQRQGAEGPVAEAGVSDLAA